MPRVPKVDNVRNQLDTDPGTTRPTTGRVFHNLLPVNPPDLSTRSGGGGGFGGGTPPVPNLGAVRYGGGSDGGSGGGFGGPPPPGPAATVSSLSPAPSGTMPLPSGGGPQLGVPGDSGAPPQGGGAGGPGAGGRQGGDQERKTASYIKGEDLFTMTGVNPPPPVIGDTPPPAPTPAPAN